MKKSFLAPFCLLVLVADGPAAQPVTTVTSNSVSETLDECRALQTAGDTSTASSGERNPESSGAAVAAATRKLSYALRIRLLVESWHVPDPATLQSRLDAARSAIYSRATDNSPDRADSAKTKDKWAAVRFAVSPPTGEVPPDSIPEEEHLREAYQVLLLAYPGGPRPTAAAPSLRLPSPGNVTYTFLQPVGSSLPTESIGGAGGISFQQAFIEAATAYLLDRARADLAYSGLLKLNDSLKADAFKILMPESRLLITTLDPRSLTSRDPRLFLSALQGAVGRDIERLPIAIAAQHSRGNSTETAASWRLAHHMLCLLSDLQGGQHPFVAVASRAQHVIDDRRDVGLSGAEESRRILQLGILASLMAELADDAAGVYSRHALGLAEGRRLAAIFVEQALLGNQSGQIQVAEAEAGLVEARLMLEELALEVAQLRERFAQVRAANPAQAAALYGDLMTVAGKLTRHVAPDGARESLDALLRIREAAVRRDYQRAIVESLRILQTTPLPDAALDSTHTHLLLAAAALASAQNADDIYGVLISFATPPNSFEDRRVAGRWALTVTTYVGGTIGNEVVRVGDDERETAGHAGAFLPVGLELTYSPDAVFGSIGLFLSLGNFGTFADHRLGTGPRVESTPAYEFRNLWNPGLYLTVGLTRSIPLSAGIGISHASGLRRLEQDRRENAVRASFFLAVDIPLLPISRSR